MPATKTLKDLTVADVITRYFNSQKGFVSEGTLEWYTYYLAPLKEQLGDKKVRLLKTDDIRSLYHSIDPSTHTPYTLFNFVRAWKRLFKWATDEGLIKNNPTSKLRRPPVPKKSPSGILDDDLAKLFDVARKSTKPKRDYAILCFLVDTGARLGGAASLLVENLDLERRRAIVTEKGRGGKKERVVFFSQNTAEALKDWLNERGLCEDKRVFLLKPYGIYQLLRRLSTRAGVKGRWNPHAFRHAFARRLLAKGVSIGIVSHLMGHSSVNVTIDFYGRFSNDELQAIYDKVME